MKRHSQRGVALVITLIMLSVITLLAVAFLAMSRRNKEAVGNSQNQADARDMNNAALSRAEADMLTRMLWTVTPTTTNVDLLNFELMVSTNYINPAGYDNTPPKYPEDPANINFDYTTASGQLGPDDWIRNIGNLSYNPRVPVFVMTNAAYPNNLEFRFYLDLNRNGVFDTNGLGIVVGKNGYYDTNGVEFPNFNLVPGNPYLSNYFKGDPEWIGILERPDRPHSGTNRFIGRYCYIVLPIGKSLDLNAIHNQAKRPVSTNLDGFLRNQGYGSWEMNLAGFLADLNTNYWNTNGFRYAYNTNSPGQSAGWSFDDARELLRYRYSSMGSSANGSYRNLRSAGAYYTTPPLTTLPLDFRIDGIDNYADGPLVLSNSFDETIPANKDPIDIAWAGSDNTNSYFNLFDELFDTNKVSPNGSALLSDPFKGFVARLKDSGKQTNSYDRNTFYRLLSQMATDSAPENAGRININYKDQSSFLRWTNDPVEFFTNTAMRLLSAHYGQPVTNIHIHIYSSQSNAFNTYTNYAPEIHRLLQVAANIYDATQTNSYPAVFRPLFSRDTSGGKTNVYISNFLEQNSQTIPTNVWLQLPKVVTDPTLLTDDMVYGIPLIIGAKKGLPNLNEVSVQTKVSVTRRLEVRKPSVYAALKDADKSGWSTNQEYILGIQNFLGIEAWNSYTNDYPRPLTMVVTNQLMMNLTNQSGEAVFVTNAAGGGFIGGTYPITNNAGKTIITNWQRLKYVLPIYAEVTNLLPSVYVAQGNYFRQAAGYTNMEPNNNNGFYFYVPEWWISITNRLRYMLVDNGKIIDFVNTGDMVSTNNLYQDINKVGVNTLNNELWDTTRADGSTNNKVNQYPTRGIEKTIRYSFTKNKIGDKDWDDYGNGELKECAIEKFYAFMHAEPYPGTLTCSDSSLSTNTLQMQVPYTPSWYMAYSNSWQVNDPLVHYTVADLKFYGMLDPLTYDEYLTFSFTNRGNLGAQNDAYSPWGGNPKGVTKAPSDYDFRFKDSLIRQSSDWDFPTNLFASIGLLGRVHRGTPWQTIYLKADVAPTNEWNIWSGHTNLYPNNVPVSFFTQPTNDWRLLDVFTVSPNDNAGRGLLSVNQTNLAAWSAALSGVLVLSNSTTDTLLKAKVAPTFTVTNIQPSSAQMSTIWSAIIATNRALHGFTHMGDFLSVPQLTSLSPYLTNNVAPQTLNVQRQLGISDAAYERIPQQILSLLKLGEPRFVVYTWGQSLKPADNSIVFNPPSDRPELQNLCTNYQVTGEVSTRAVIRIDTRTEGTNKNYQAVMERYNILSGD